MKTTTPVVRTDHLAKTYTIGFFRKKIHALQDLSIRVEPGEIFGLLGPNGAGKTTTLKILMGLVRPTSGIVELLGSPIGLLTAKRQVGYLPENPYFYDYLTGQELLVFMAKLFGQSRKEAQRRAGMLLEQVGLAHAADLALRRYSKGMLQRVGVAQTLIHDPKIVILDEPLTGLDPIGRKDLRELIANLRKEGKTVVLASHILSDVELLADRVTILVRGKSVNSGPLHQLLNARILSTEIVVRDPHEAFLLELQNLGHSAIRLADAAQIIVEGDQPVDSIIDLVRKHGCSIQMVTPRQESLEDVVVKQVREHAQ